MKSWTLAEIRAKLEADTDTEDEDFIRADEFTELVNDAIEEAESHILGLYEDYFLTYTDIALTAGTTEVNLPDGIYVHKIRRVIFRNGAKTYPVVRLRDWRKFEEKADFDASSSTAQLRYLLVNRIAETARLLLVPTPTEDGSLRVWHIRTANRLVEETDVCDIPFIQFIFAHVKEKIYAKEGSAFQPDAAMKLEQKREQLLSTLAQNIPDADNDIESDFSHYEDMN